MAEKRYVIAPNARLFHLWCHREGLSPYDRSHVSWLSTAEHVRGLEHELPVTVVDAPGWTDEASEALRAVRSRGNPLTWTTV
jgi:hypothetical protein